MWKPEYVSDARLSALKFAARMEECGRVLETMPTLSEISSIATELAALRRYAIFTEDDCHPKMVRD